MDDDEPALELEANEPQTKEDTDCQGHAGGTIAAVICDSDCCAAGSLGRQFLLPEVPLLRVPALTGRDV